MEKTLLPPADVDGLAGPLQVSISLGIRQMINDSRDKLINSGHYTTESGLGLLRQGFECVLMSHVHLRKDIAREWKLVIM
jgi:hypothetical protein